MTAASGRVRVRGRCARGRAGRRRRRRPRRQSGSRRGPARWRRAPRGSTGAPTCSRRAGQDRPLRERVRRDRLQPRGRRVRDVARAGVDVNGRVAAGQHAVVGDVGGATEQSLRVAHRQAAEALRAEIGRAREPPRRSMPVRRRHAHAARRERRPADPAAARSPGDPRRPPHRARHPAPAEAGHDDPAAVVEGRPAPAPVGHPGPAELGQHPVAARVVGREVGADQRRVRRPDPPVAAVVDPVAVGRELVLELRVSLRVVAVVVAVDHGLLGGDVLRPVDLGRVGGRLVRDRAAAGRARASGSAAPPPRLLARTAAVRPAAAAARPLVCWPFLLLRLLPCSFLLLLRLRGLLLGPLGPRPCRNEQRRRQRE